MVGHPPLGKIISANALRAVTTTDQITTHITWRIDLFLHFFLLNFGYQHFHGFIAVGVLATLLLTLDHRACWNMGNTHRRVSFIDMLTTCPTGTISIDTQVGRVDIHGIINLNLWHHCDRASRSMHPSLAFSLWHPLHPVCATFKL